MAPRTPLMFWDGIALRLTLIWMGIRNQYPGGRSPSTMTDIQARATGCLLRTALCRVNRYRQANDLEPLVLKRKPPVSAPEPPLVEEDRRTRQLEQDLERLNALRTAAGRRPLALAIVDEPKTTAAAPEPAPEQAPDPLPTVRIVGGAHGTDTRLYLNGQPFDHVRAVTLRVAADHYTTADLEVLAETVETTTEGVIVASLADGTRYLLRDAVELPKETGSDETTADQYARMLESERTPASTPAPDAPIQGLPGQTLAPNVERTLHTLLINVQEAAQYHFPIGDLIRIAHAIRTAYRLGHQDGRKEPALRYHMTR